MSSLEERLDRLPRRGGRPTHQDLQETAARLKESERLNSLPRWGKALHDRTRLTMIALMNLAGELTSTELQAVMRLSQGNVGRHLWILKRSGIIKGKTRHKPKPKKRSHHGWSLGLEPVKAEEPAEKGQRILDGGAQVKREDGRRTYYSVQPSTARLLP